MLEKRILTPYYITCDLDGNGKMDIEGAELNVFEKSPQHWIEKVNSIVIELHESFAPGCSQTFDAAIAGEFHTIAETRELKLVSR